MLTGLTLAGTGDRFETALFIGHSEIQQPKCENDDGGDDGHK
jgi:hypothetical protein